MIIQIDVLAYHDGTVNNRLTLLYGTTSNSVRALMKSNGVTSFDFQATNITSLNFNKIAVKYKENDFALWVNGLEVGTDTSGNTSNRFKRTYF